jgi:cyclohexanone monooxygenase
LAEVHPAQATVQTDAVVIGAGFGGMYMLYRLREMGLSTVVFEAGKDVGGTWYWNRYPGARCDIESIEYCYAFMPELDNEWRWSERFSTQPEILAYAQYVAERFDLRRDIRFESKVVAAHYDDRAARWTVTTDHGDTVTARYIITATGCLSLPKDPAIPGLASFSGRAVFTHSWPHDGVELSGMRVGVIGTGSTGIQVIPVVAEQAASLTVFQRTPNYSVPAQNRALSDEEYSELKSNYETIREKARIFGNALSPAPELSALEVSPAERVEMFEQLWQGGGPTIQAAFIDIMTDDEANRHASDFVRNKIAGIVKDPEIARKLQPTDYPIGAKRVCVDTNYFAAYNRSNVKLVDLRDEPLQSITPAGVLTAAGEYDLDVIILATGFDAVTGPLLAMDIVGSNGVSLRSKWADGARAYLGLATAGFPNLFMITGPGSPSIFGNVIVAIEQHVNWLTELLRLAEHEKVKRIECAPHAEEQWVRHVAEVTDGTLFAFGNHWFLGANIPGKPKAYLAYAGGFGVYRDICAGVAERDYEGFSFT